MRLAFDAARNIKQLTTEQFLFRLRAGVYHANALDYAFQSSKIYKDPEFYKALPFIIEQIKQRYGQVGMTNVLAALRGLILSSRSIPPHLKASAALAATHTFYEGLRGNDLYPNANRIGSIAHWVQRHSPNDLPKITEELVECVERRSKELGAIEAFAVARALYPKVPKSERDDFVRLHAYYLQLTKAGTSSVTKDDKLSVNDFIADVKKTYKKSEAAVSIASENVPGKN
jgi:hypothetical protein